MQNAASLADADREFFLAIYKQAVDFYQPRIERKTGVRLGKISVWDYSECYAHKLRHFNASVFRRLWSVIFRKRYRAIRDAVKASYDEFAAKYAAVYFNSGIYV